MGGKTHVSSEVLLLRQNSLVHSELRAQLVNQALHDILVAFSTRHHPAKPAIISTPNNNQVQARDMYAYFLKTPS